MADNRLLYQNLSVMACSLGKTLCELFPVFSLGYAPGGACVGRFNKYRISKPCFHPFHRFGHPLCTCNLLFHHRLVGCLPHSYPVGNNLCKKLIHRYGGSQNSTADIWELRQLKKSLDCTIFPIKTMQHGKCTIYLDFLYSGPVYDNDTFFRCIRGENSLNRTISPAFILNRLHRIYQQPVSLFRNSHDKDIICISVYIINHIYCRHAGDNML